jgi:polyhydroxyalkanoate synthesis regulator phasin
MNERESRPGGLGGIGEGLRTGVGVLNAFREAIEETVSEALESGGDVSPERAKALMRDAAQRVQNSFEETRERLDFVSRREFEELRREIADLRAQIAALHGGEVIASPSASSDAPASDEDHEGIIIVSD